MTPHERTIEKSPLISRDLSWLQFNLRVLAQARKKNYTLAQRLRFLAVASGNLDEFFMIRVGSLYNYIDYQRERIDYSGLTLHPFQEYLLSECKKFHEQQHSTFVHYLAPYLSRNNIHLAPYSTLLEAEKAACTNYFTHTIYPMLTPMASDAIHSFPTLINHLLVFGVLTKKNKTERISFLQIPKNIPRFHEIKRENSLLFVPVESIVEAHIIKCFKNTTLVSATLFRVTRDGDFTWEDSEDIERNFLDDLKAKLRLRRLGRVVRVEVRTAFDPLCTDKLKKAWKLDARNFFYTPRGALIDYSSFYQILNHPNYRGLVRVKKIAIPISLHGLDKEKDMFKVLSQRDILLHHPYNSFHYVLRLLEQAAQDPEVLAIKVTIYRVAMYSQVIDALQLAAENGKYVCALFEVKARFDEEKNLREAKRLEKAGCYVIYGGGILKTHSKMLLIVRKEQHRVVRYAHIGTGNYNEDTARVYGDLGFMTAKDTYTHDVSEFFNVITGHSYPEQYEHLITSPREMSRSFMAFIQREIDHKRKGIPASIVIKVNSLQDKGIIKQLYKASAAGVVVKLIVRGICCLRPGREKLSENISVRSIVGRYLEHARIFYFENYPTTSLYIGSADIMVRSLEDRVESIVSITEDALKHELITILYHNLTDNANSYQMNEDGTYTPLVVRDKKEGTLKNVHEILHAVTPNTLRTKADLDTIVHPSIKGEKLEKSSTKITKPLQPSAQGQ